MKIYEYDIKVECGLCNGTGQDTEWVEKKGVMVWIIRDCSICDGTGKIMVKVKDFRRIATKKSAYLPEHT